MAVAREVEIRLRVPNMKVRVMGPDGYPIDHSSVRFRKVITVPSIPKPDETLELATKSGQTLQAKVVRADWHEGLNRFVVACRYASQSITPEQYRALADDPEWELKHLLE